MKFYVSVMQKCTQIFTVGSVQKVAMSNGQPVWIDGGMFSYIVWLGMERECDLVRESEKVKNVKKSKEM